MSCPGIPAITAIRMAMSGNANKALIRRLYMSIAMQRKTKRQAIPINMLDIESWSSFENTYVKLIARILFIILLSRRLLDDFVCMQLSLSQEYGYRLCEVISNGVVWIGIAVTLQISHCCSNWDCPDLSALRFPWCLHRSVTHFRDREISNWSNFWSMVFPLSRCDFCLRAV